MKLGILGMVNPLPLSELLLTPPPLSKLGLAPPKTGGLGGV